MRKIYTLITALLLTCTFSAQEVGVSIELVYADDGSMANFPEGYSTWHIYAVLPGTDDFLSGVYAAMGEDPLSIETTGLIWNSGVGSTSGANINPVLYDDYPELQYDSWITVGESEMGGTGEVQYISLLPTFSAFEDTFGVGDGTDFTTGDFYLEDGMWFNIIGDPDGTAGDDNKVLIAQVTTNGDISVCMNFQVFEGGMNGDLTFYDQYCGSELNPIPTTVESTQGHMEASISPNPMNEMTQISLNGLNADRIEVRDISGKLVSTLNVNSQNEMLHRGNLNTGFYLVQILDKKGVISESHRLVVQ